MAVYINYCPKCYKKPTGKKKAWKGQEVAYCNGCKQWGQQARFSDSNLAWGWIRYLKRKFTSSLS